ncbi:MAG: hypothetical protein DCC71_21145 [Proteobacteria bacterium]|nr:MAG: hypothetical protein DCC71_21145 [Pseudomonadota bacterium]
MAALLVGCTSPRPLLYPNAHYEEQGEAAAQAEIDRCIELARVYAEGGAERAKEAAKGTAKSAVVGGATGAVVGAIAGRPGTGAAIGAAGSATANVMSRLLNSQGLDPVEQRYVEHCLRERGYDPIGWR